MHFINHKNQKCWVKSRISSIHYQERWMGVFLLLIKRTCNEKPFTHFSCCFVSQALFPQSYLCPFAMSWNLRFAESWIIEIVTPALSNFSRYYLVQNSSCLLNAQKKSLAFSKLANTCLSDKVLNDLGTWIDLCKKPLFVSLAKCIP